MNAPTSFGLGLFLRVVIPGFFAVALASPLSPPNVLSANNFVVLAGLSTAVGFATVLLDSFFYQLFEGRILWPADLREEKTKLWEQWLDARWAEIARVEAERNSSREGTSDRRNLTTKLGRLYGRVTEFAFFREDQRPHAVSPTRFGNLMASYEYYPETRYGMDSSFYWYRLWLLVPDKTRTEYDEFWAIGQVWLYLAALSALFVAIYGLLTLWVGAVLQLSMTDVLSAPRSVMLMPRISGGLMPFPATVAPGWPVGIALAGLTGVSFLLWFFTYRLAIIQHVSNGEFFKALFDVYREDLEVQPFAPGTKGDWWDAYYFLQYFRGGSVLGRAKKGIIK